jgi:hypothetical protein
LCLRVLLGPGIGEIGVFAVALTLEAVYLFLVALVQLLRVWQNVAGEQKLGLSRSATVAAWSCRR